MYCMFLEWELFREKDVEKIEQNILCSIKFFLRKSFRLLDNVEKYGRARRTIDDNTVRRGRDVICMPDN